MLGARFYLTRSQAHVGVRLNTQYLIAPTSSYMLRGDK